MQKEIFIPPIDPRQVSAPSREIYAAMGEENIFKMMEDFYVELGASEIKWMFAQTPERLRASAHKSALFFVGLLGGPPLYQQFIGNPMMRARHMPFSIAISGRNEWLRCFERVLQHAERYNFPPQHLQSFRDFLSGFSMWMVNTAEEIQS